MSRLLLLRHGITTWNAAGRFQGHSDIPLSEDGIAQARLAAPRIASYRPTRLLCSDLARARQTADLVGEACGLAPEPDPRYREVDVGTWAGLDLETVGRLEPDFWPALREGRDFRRSPEGETATQSGQRVALALLDAVESEPEDALVVLVGHGLSLRVAALLLMGLDYSHARLFGGLVNCGWLELRPAGEHYRLQSYNLVADDAGPWGNSDA
jgi:probable phosphoglycerate mutase